MDRFLTLHKFGDADAKELDIKLRAMTGRESLSELFNFRLFADLPQDKVSELSADDIMGKRVIFSIHQPEMPLVFFSGILSHLSLGNVSKEHRRSCNFEVVPELWKLTETLDTRRHPSNKVVDLIAAVLEERKLDLKLVDLVTKDEKRHPDRVNPVQYEEAYYDFLVRHMKEESIYFYHREQYTEKDGKVDGEQTLVIGDDPRGFFVPELNSEDDSNSILELRFQLMENISNQFDARTWDRQFNFKPASWTINDFDYQKANDFAMTRAGDSGETPFRKFKAHAGFYSKDYADEMLANLAEQEDVSREFVLSTSDCPYLTPGCRFHLKGHPIKSENGEYIVTSVEHKAFEDLYGTGADTEYENRFTCVPATRIPTCCPHTDGGGRWPAQVRGQSAGAAYDPTAIYDSSTFADFQESQSIRSNYSTKALATGIVAESAWVVDSAGKHDDPTTMGTVYVRTDPNTADPDEPKPRGISEVLIRYTWETVTGEAGKSTWVAPASSSASSRWVRVAQLAAGSDWGAKFIPRVGEEVVVLYLDGEKKKPVIVGSLFNSANKTANMNDRKTDTLNILGGQGGDDAFARFKAFGITDDPGEPTQVEMDEFNSLSKTEQKVQLEAWRAEGKHLLNEGPSKDADGNLLPPSRPVPNLRDDDVSGIRTRSDAGITPAPASTAYGDGTRYNEMLFKDTKDQEELYMHAARDFNIDVENDMHIVVHGDVHEVIHGKYYRSVNVDDTDWGPVNRSIVGGDSFDLDRVWEYKAVEGTGHPFKVKTEVYANTETRSEGDVKEAHMGTTESYYLGNTWEMNVAAAESLTIGFTLDIFAGIKMEFCGAFSLEVSLAGAMEISGGGKIEYEKVATMYISPAKVDLTNLGVEQKDCDISDVKLSVNKHDVHIIKADVIVLDAKLIVINGLQTINQNTAHWIT